MTRGVRGLVVTVGVLAALAAASGVQAQGTTDALRREDAQAIHSLLDEMVARWNADDLEGHVAAYADDATYTAGDRVLQGRAAIIGTLGGFRTADGLYGTLGFEDIAMRALGQNFALVTGRYVLTEAGQAPRKGRFTLVMARRDGAWQVIHDHSS